MTAPKHFFFAWRKKLVVRVSVNRLLAVLCGLVEAGELEKNVELNEMSCQYTWFTLKPLSLAIHSAWIYFSYLLHQAVGAVIYCETQKKDTHLESLSSMSGLREVDMYENLIPGGLHIHFHSRRTAELQRKSVNGSNHYFYLSFNSCPGSHTPICSSAQSLQF